MTEKFGAIPYQHAEWISKNRLADPVTGADSDGYLLSALTSGVHANFDGSVMEDAADDGSLSVATVDVKGDLIVCDSTALNTVTRLPAVAKGRFFVSQGVGEQPVYAAAAASTAAGALPLLGAGVDIAYVEPVAAGRMLISKGVNLAPAYNAAAGTNNSFGLFNAAADATFLAPGTVNQVLKGVGAATAPAWTTVDFSGSTGTGGTVGQIAVTNMTATGAVVVTPLADLGGALVLSHVVCGVGLITIYTKDLDVAGGAVAAADTKAFAVHVIKLA
jgi:hypothetical protein